VFKNFGSTELLVIALVMLFLFGGRKLPELARGVGDSIKEIKRAAKES
jgi:sec-independent protein translocase protein TatA